MAKVFISYKRSDKEKVFPIVKTIQEYTGIDCWIDLSGIESGDQFEHVIIKAINDCDIVVFMMSKNSVAPYFNEKTNSYDYSRQTWTEREVRFAMDKGKRIIPLSIDGTGVSECDWLAFNLSGVDSVCWSDNDLRTKFLCNLRAWCGDDANTPANAEAGREDLMLTSERRKWLLKWPTYLAVLVLVLTFVCGLGWWMFRDYAVKEPATSDGSIQTCKAQIYLMRYRTLNGLYENAFSDTLVDCYCYEDSIVEDEVYIYPRSKYLTLDVNVPVVLTVNQEGEERAFPYHNPVIQLKMHSNDSKTRVFNKYELEVSQFEKYNDDICRFERCGNELRIYNEGCTIVDGNMKYTPLREGEVSMGYSHSLDLEIGSLFSLTLDNGSAGIDGLWNDVFKVKNSNQQIPDFQDQTIDIPTILIEKTGTVPVGKTCSMKIGLQDGFTHSLIPGETDDETYISISAPYSCKMQLRAVLTDIQGEKLYSPFIHVNYIKPRSGKLCPHY